MKKSILRIIYVSFLFLSILVVSSSAYAAKAYIPHLTSGFSDWGDYLQVDSKSLQEQDFTLTLYADGTVVYQAAHTVSALSQTAIDLKTLTTTAQCGEIEYTEGTLFFRLSFQNAGGGLVEFKLADTLSSALDFYFSSFSPTVEWKGLALANIGDTAVNVTLMAIGSGDILDAVQVSIGAFTRIFGIHSDWFPDIDMASVNKIVAVSSTPTLCGIVKNGNMSNSNLLFTSASEITTGEYSGTWDGTFSSRTGSDGDLTFYLLQDGTDFTGRMDGSGTQLGNLENYSVSGTIISDQLSGTSAFKYQGSNVTVTFTGNFISSDTLDGTYTSKFDGTTYETGDFLVDRIW